MKRLAIYQKSSYRPIIISDNSSKTIEELTKMIETKLFTSDKIYILKTDTDCLIGRPSEVQSVLITTDKKNLNLNSHDEVNDKKEIAKNNTEPPKPVEESKNDKPKEVPLETPKTEEEPKKGIIKITKVKIDPKKENKQTVQKDEQPLKKTLSVDELKNRIQEKKKEEQKRLDDMITTFNNLPVEHDL